MDYKQYKSGFKQAFQYMNRSEAPKPGNRNLKKAPEEDKKTEPPTPEVKIIVQKEQPKATAYTDLSQERLQEAFIWSEILGKPVCKRRERRQQW